MPAIQSDQSNSTQSNHSVPNQNDYNQNYQGLCNQSYYHHGSLISTITFRVIKTRMIRSRLSRMIRSRLSRMIRSSLPRVFKAKSFKMIKSRVLSQFILMNGLNSVCYICTCVKLHMVSYTPFTLVPEIEPTWGSLLDSHSVNITNPGQLNTASFAGSSQFIPGLIDSITE